MEIAHDLTKVLQSKGANIVGFADLGDIPPAARNGLPLGISIVVALNPGIVAGIVNGPTRAYYDEYERANKLLESLGRDAETFLRRNGYEAACLAVTEVGIDPKTHSTQLPHKTVATKAGVGWIGKCALLVTESFGAAVRLTTVLTDARLPKGNPIETSRCGKCQECVKACPGQAPSGQNWRVDVHRDQFFDVFACRIAARRMAFNEIGIKNTICGICIAVCPYTTKYINRIEQG